ncbi:hypothetical protein ACYZTL_26715 [Pseudomonas sp. LB3P81]
MPQLTLSTVAKLYGMHRTTLYAAIKAGRVSAGENHKGQKVIELSEAIRAWGEPEGRPGHEFDSSTPLPTVELSNSTAPVEQLMTEATALRLATAMERLIEIEEAKLLLIEHKPGDVLKNEESQPAMQDVIPEKPQSFADLLAGLK